MRPYRILIGECNYHLPKTKEELANMGIAPLAPYPCETRDPTPKRSIFLRRFRHRIATIFSQLTGRYSEQTKGLHGL